MRFIYLFFGCFHVASIFSNLLDRSSQKDVFLYDVPRV